MPEIARRVKNQRWVEYGTMTEVPHGLGWELLEMNGLPSTGYSKTRRKQLNRFWGDIYQRLVWMGVINHDLIEEMWFPEEDLVPGHTGFDEPEQRELGRLIAQAIVHGGLPVILVAPFEHSVRVVQGDDVQCIPCEYLTQDELEDVLQNGRVLLQNASHIAPVSRYSGEKCVVTLENDLGAGVTEWSLVSDIGHGLLNRFTLDMPKRELNNITPKDARWAGQQEAVLADLKESINSMLETASTPWEKKVFGEWRGEAYGITTVPREEAEDFINRYRKNRTKLELARAGARILDIPVHVALIGGSVVVTDMDGKRLNVSKLVKVARDAGVEPPESIDEDIYKTVLSYTKV